MFMTSIYRKKSGQKVEHIHAEQMSFHHFKEIGFDVINMNYQVQRKANMK